MNKFKKYKTKCWVWEWNQPLKCRDSEVKRHEISELKSWPRNVEIMATKKWKLSLKVSPQTEIFIIYFVKSKGFNQIIDTVLFGKKKYFPSFFVISWLYSWGGLCWFLQSLFRKTLTNEQKLLLTSLNLFFFGVKQLWENKKAREIGIENSSSSVKDDL